jgi:hypothetical protein
MMIVSTVGVNEDTCIVAFVGRRYGPLGGEKVDEVDRFNSLAVPFFTSFAHFWCESVSIIIICA